MLFPMYTVALDVVLRMTKISPHEELKDEGKLINFHSTLGKALFVSHQWVGIRHPDPEFKQFKVLQEALQYARAGLQSIPVDLVAETMFPSAKGLPTSELFAAPLFIWYDYFSCPQLELSQQNNAISPSGERLLTNAINSIPAYVAESTFFFALCPVVEDDAQCTVYTPSSWADRGWCRPCRSTFSANVFVEISVMLVRRTYCQDIPRSRLWQAVSVAA